VEPLDEATLSQERLMLGLRLDEPLPLAAVAGVVDAEGLARLERLGLARRRDETLCLTSRGRFLGGAATVEILAEIPANSGVTVG
jgi:coproporphyrinogen III oxidase-like Fe-S oxidoreductase